MGEHTMGVPNFSVGGGGGASQDRARGCHLTAVNTLSIQPAGGGGGGGVLFPFSRFSQLGVCMYVNFYYKGEERHSVPKGGMAPPAPLGTPMHTTHNTIPIHTSIHVHVHSAAQFTQLVPPHLSS